MQHMASTVAALLNDGQEVGNIKVDLSMQHLKQHIMKWLLNAWKRIKAKPDLIKKGWEKCGLLRAFEASFQAAAQERHNDGELFNAGLEAEPPAAEEPAPLQVHEDDEDIPLAQLLLSRWWAKCPVDGWDIASHIFDDKILEDDT